MLRQKIDTLIHQIHNLRVEVVSGRRTRNERCRCSRHNSLIEVRLAGAMGTLMLFCGFGRISPTARIETSISPGAVFSK
jgi:hypothetical protein